MSGGSTRWERRYRTLVAAIVVILVVGAPVASVVGVASVASASTATTSDSSPPVLGFADSGGTLTTYNDNGTTTSLDVSGQVTGPMADIDGDGELELPYVDSNGNVHLVDRQGETQTMNATNAPTGKSFVATADVDGDGEVAVLYPNTSDNSYIYAVEYGEQERRVTTAAQASAVLGVVDYDGDGHRDIVYIGSSNGNIKYYDLSDGTVTSTEYSSIGSNNGLGVGAPADFDGDGTPRVPIVDGSQNIGLVAADGTKTTLKSPSAAKAPVGAVNYTGDSALEIAYVDGGGELSYVTLGDSVGLITSGGNAITATKALGVVSAAPPPEPTISDYSVTNPEKRQINVSFTSNQELADIAVDITSNGTTVATLTESDFTESVSNGAYHYVGTYVADTDGNYTATLVRAADADGNDGAENQSGTVSVDGPPTVSNYSVSNPEKRQINVSFTSSEQLTDIGVDVDGPVPTTLTEGDFAETTVDGNYSYVATYTPDEDGNYTATLFKAVDDAGYDGASNQSETVSVDGPPFVSNYSVSNPEKRQINVSFTSSEQLTDIGVDVDGPVPTTLTEGDFAETTVDGGYHYVTTYSPDEDGNYTATLFKAVDDAGYDGASNQTESVSVNAPPRVLDFGMTNPSGQNLTVSVTTGEALADIRVEVDGPDATTLTEGEFAQTSSEPFTYVSNFSVAQDGNYTATLRTAADDTGLDGADGQNVTVVVDNPDPNVTNVSAVDLADHDGIVSGGDDVRVTATVEGDYVDSVRTDLSALGVGTVTLDQTATETYAATVTVDGSDAIRDGGVSPVIRATNVYNNSDRMQADELLVDTVDPVADAGENVTVDEDTSVYFDAAGSSDNVGIARHVWQFGDGETTTGESVTHVFADPGNYTVTLTVVDVAGNRDTANRTITVQNVSDDGSTSDTTDDGGDTIVYEGDTTKVVKRIYTNGTTTNGTTTNETTTTTATNETDNQTTNTTTVDDEERQVVVFERTSVDSIAFATPTSGTVTVEQLDALPERVPTYPGTVVRPLRIDPPRDDVAASIVFSVNRSAFDAAPERVVLARYHDGQWQSLETSVLSSDATTVTFTAQTPGFSYFVVGVPASGTNDTTTSTTATDEDRESVATPQGTNWSGWLLVLVLLAALLGGTFYAYRTGALSAISERFGD